MNKKIMSIMLCGMLLVSGLFISTARAENSIGTNVVTGNEYVCFFVSSVDIFSSQVSFTETGGLTISSFGGYGFYITVTNLFTGSYISLNARIGTKTGDIIMLLVGSTFEPTPFIAGTGVILLEYTEIIPLVFSGFAATTGP
jgi:hypothetical protein